MTDLVLVTAAAYIVAGGPLHPLARRAVEHETARRGNAYGMAGMALALVATLLLVLDDLADDCIVDRRRSLIGARHDPGRRPIGAVIGIGWPAASR